MTHSHVWQASIIFEFESRIISQHNPHSRIAVWNYYMKSSMKSSILTLWNRLLLNWFNESETTNHSSLCAITPGWRQCIGCLKVQVSFRQRAAKNRARSRNITYKRKASYASSPPNTLNYYMKSLWSKLCEFPPWISSCLAARMRLGVGCVAEFSKIHGIVLWFMGRLRSVGSIKLWVSFAEHHLLYRAFFAKETYNFKEPTNRSHPIVDFVASWLLRISTCVQRQWGDRWGIYIGSVYIYAYINIKYMCIQMYSEDS